MLPRLAQRYSLRKALLLHGFIWWAWHIPALVKIGAQTGDAASALARWSASGRWPSP